MMIKITARHMVGGLRHEHIAEVAWVNTQSAQTGRSSREAMVNWLSTPGNRAIVQTHALTIDVHVVNANPPYIQTYADGTRTDNLLALPQY
jgi:hypothetical protein